MRWCRCVFGLGSCGFLILVGGFIGVMGCGWCAIAKLVGFLMFWMVCYDTDFWFCSVGFVVWVWVVVIVVAVGVNLVLIVEVV